MDEIEMLFDSNFSSPFTKLPSSSQNKCRELIEHVYSEAFQRPETFGKALAMISLSFTIIGGNLLVILAVMFSSRLRTVTNFFIASLAVSDFVIGVGVLPFSFTQDLLGFWTFGHMWCRIWLALDVWVSTASIYNLVVIALDRYVAVTRPLSYLSLVTPKRAAAAVCGAWAWSFLVSFPPMVTFQSNSDGKSKPPDNEDAWTGLVDCQCTALDNSALYIFFSASSSFYLPFLILFYIYIKIYIKIRQATAAVDKGYMMVKKAHGSDFSMDPETESVHSETIGNGSKGHSCTRQSSSPLSSGAQNGMRKSKSSCSKRKLKPGQQMEGKNRLGPSLSSPVTLRVHRGRYNAAGATETTPRPIKKADQDFSSTSGLKRVPTIKFPSTSGDGSEIIADAGATRDEHELSKEEAASGDRRMAEFARRVSNKKISTSASGSFLDVDGCALVDKRDQSNRQNSSRDTLGVPRGTVRQRLYERYDKKLKREIRAAKTVALVTGCFFLCWSGFCIVYTMKALPFCHDAGGESCVPSWAFAVVLWLGYANSALNPLIYAVCNRQFRLTFKRILCSCFCNGRKNSKKQCASLFRRGVMV